MKTKYLPNCDEHGHEVGVFLPCDHQLRGCGSSLFFTIASPLGSVVNEALIMREGYLINVMSSVTVLTQ
jgi:hypothetical protein